MVSSLFLRSVPLFLVLGQLGEAQQSYQLDTEYSGASFFEGWDFITVRSCSIKQTMTGLMCQRDLIQPMALSSKSCVKIYKARLKGIVTSMILPHRTTNL